MFPKMMTYYTFYLYTTQGGVVDLIIPASPSVYLYYIKKYA